MHAVLLPVSLHYDAHILNLQYLQYTFLSSPDTDIFPRPVLSSEMVPYIIGTLSAFTLCLQKLIQSNPDYLLQNKIMDHKDYFQPSHKAPG